jgi:hypothetical protein
VGRSGKLKIVMEERYYTTEKNNNHKAASPINCLSAKLHHNIGKY